MQLHRQQPADCPTAHGGPCQLRADIQHPDLPTWHVLPALQAPNQVKLAVREGLLQRVCRQRRQRMRRQVGRQAGFQGACMTTKHAAMRWTALQQPSPSSVHICAA